MLKGTLRTCKNGHQYYKSSDCPTCPVCEAERKPDSGFLSELPAPARRALEGASINTLKKLSATSKKDILKLHGMGPASIPKLERALKSQGLSFQKIRVLSLGMTHYEVLGVAENATSTQIRDAYRKLVKQYHPDKNPLPEAAEFIKRINEAYDVLSDAERRTTYDGRYRVNFEPVIEETREENSSSRVFKMASGTRAN